MKTEHLAIVAALNNFSLATKADAVEFLTRVPAGRVAEHLDDALERMSGHQTNWKDDRLQRFVRERLTAKAVRTARDHIVRMRKTGIRMVPYWDADYPEGLSRIANPPLILYVRGQWEPNQRSIAVVGSRNASNAGLEIAREFSEEVAARGFAVVSGLAFGVDAAAHEGALGGSGRTVAVLPTNPLRITPKTHTALAAQIVATGSLIGEATPDIPPQKVRYIERNRITSGLADSLVVIEADEGGGAFHQARFALAQGKRVYVIDRRTSRPSAVAAGASALIRMGGQAVEDITSLSTSVTTPAS